MKILQTIEFFIDKVVDYMVSFGVFGGFTLVFLEAFFPPLPIGVIVGLNILSFGNFIGFTVSYIATVMGCIITFIVFRYFLKEKFNKWFNKKKRANIEKWMNKLSNIRFSTLVILLALPITPSFVFNMAGGLSNISLKKYFIALLIGKPVMLLICAYIAVSFKEAIEKPIIFIKVFVLIILTYIISKVIEKIVKVE